MSDCSICLEQITQSTCKNKIKCSNCDSIVCEECCVRLLEFCKREIDIPRCSDCRTEFLQEQLPDTLLVQYNSVCVNYLLNEPEIKDALIKIQNQEKFKQKIIKERIEFVRDNYPVAIKKVIDLAFSKQLKKINKNNKKEIYNILNKKCLNEVCKKGMLFELNGDTWKCNLCDDSFCMKCEQISKTNHTCKKDDLESISLRDSFVKCPKCKLPVVKSEGCNDITCSICKTRFDYITGEIGGGGNHTNTSLTLKNPTAYRLSQLYHKKYSSTVITLLARIESLEPIKVMDIASITKMIIKIDIKENKELENHISKKYMLYKQNKRNNELYFKSLVEIQKVIHEKVSEWELVNILQRIIVECRKYKNDQAIRSVLSQESDEYIEVKNKVTQSYPSSEILWMERIHNPLLSYRFNCSGSGEKIELFHGTKERNINNIIENGFLTKFNVVSAHGKGTYASPICKFAMSYTDTQVNSEFKFMFLCECKVNGYEKKTNEIFCFPNDSNIIPKILVVFRS